MPPWIMFPNYSLSNPYQSLLASALAPRWSVRFGDIGEAIGRAAGGVFHLHWEDAVYAGAADEAEACALAAIFLANCGAFRAAGGRLLWTIHNGAPHENRFPSADLGLRQGLAGMADLVHVHGQTAQLMARELGARRVLVAPHPSLHAHYPDDITDAAARRYWGLAQARTVFGFFGALRPYKGLDELMAAFARHHLGAEDSALLIAGRGGSEHPARWRMAAPGVRLAARQIEDAAVQYVLRAADFVVLPYRRILTSGSAMLALGFGRPVIAPALPALLDQLTPGQTMLGYTPDDPNGLQEALRQAHMMPAEDRAFMRGAARAAARAQPPERLAERLSDAISHHHAPAS